MSQPPDPDIQLYYARIIDWGTKLSFGFLLSTFTIYIAGGLAPYVPLEELPQYWSQPAHNYLEATRIKTGWGWIDEVHHGDFLNFLPIAMLAGVTFLGYFGVLFKFIRRREVILALVIIIQLLVLSLAASGIIRIGGH